MKIVVLDGYCLNPGDLDWDGLKQLGDVAVYDRTAKDQVIERAKDADIIVTNKTVLSDKIINHLAKLKYIAVLATGFNVVDIKAARARGIAVSNIPTYASDCVAQFTFALLLELCHHAGKHCDMVRAGDWSKCSDFCFWKFPLVELAGKTFGIIGFGRIGRKVAQIALAMGMRVLAYDKIKNNPLDGDFQWTDLKSLLSQSDVISLHCPQLPETTGMINASILKLIKPSAFIINTSRGGLIVEEDLAEALNEQRIAGYACDVLSSEPPSPDNPLLSAKNCIITPHIAWATKEARTRLMNIFLENVKSFLAGKPANVVN